MAFEKKHWKKNTFKDMTFEKTAEKGNSIQKVITNARKTTRLLGYFAKNSTFY